MNQMHDTSVRLPPWTVTRAAIDRIGELGGAIRIDVEDGGCCGQTYTYGVVDPAEAPSDADARFGCPGAWLVVGPRAMAVLDGATLDYAGSLKPPRFRVVRNPNTDEVCACRRSFGARWPGPGMPTCRSYAPMPWDTTFTPPARWRRQTEEHSEP